MNLDSSATLARPSARRSPRSRLHRGGITPSVLPEEVCLPELTTDAWSRTLADAIPALPATRVLFAGGGTGGHLYPAAAVARRLEDLAPGSEVVFAGSDRPLERQILSGCGFRHVALPTAPWRGARHALSFAWGQARGVMAARRLVRDFRPQVIVGLGGFPSVGPALAGRLSGIPLALFEPNASAGKANLLLARWAEEAYVHFDQTALGCPRVASGTPVDGRAVAPESLTQSEARRRLGLPCEGRVLLVMGGSQGSSAINRWIEAALSAAPEAARELSVLHLAGDEAQAEGLRAAYDLAGVRHRVLAFLPGIGVAYRAADLALVRGGGATLAELGAAGLPGCVIPMPASAGDHQRHNAEAFAASGAGWVEPQAELDQAAWSRILDRIGDETWLLEHAEAARAAAREDAADVVARRIVSLGHGLKRAGVDDR